MKKTNRAIALAVLLVMLATSVIALAACSGAKDALEGYQLAITSVKEDFTLPRKIGDNVSVKWKSDNDAIKIVKRAKQDYLAQVTLGDTVQKVTLTASAGGATKDFQVNVQALNAMFFANEYKLPQEGMEVSESFALEQTFETRGKTATITWNVADQFKSVISVSADNATCNVTLPAETTMVEIEGTFSYNNKTATKPFAFYVSQPKSEREEINHWYNNGSYTINTSGYVTGIATPYDSVFGNATFYIVADNMESAYYLYRSKASSAADGGALKVGAHVTVTGVMSSDYNGLMEAAAGSIFTVDNDIAAKTPEQLIYNLDNDVTSDVPALKWHTGALVKLTNWKVKSISDASTSKSGTLLTLEKDNATITIGYNNYMEGFYASADNKPSTELTAIKTKAGTFKVGDAITVTGILSYYAPNFQVLPRSEADIVAGTADTTPTAGSKVKAAITAVNDALKTAGINDSNGNTKFITSKLENKELPTKVGDVVISYEETFDGSATEIKDGKISVTPKANLQNTTVEVTYTVDGYTTWTYFKVRSQDLDDAGKVAYVKENIGNEIVHKYEKAGEQILPQASDFGWDGLTIEWKVKEAAATYATISGNKLTVKLPKEAGKFTLVATIKFGNSQDTFEVEISVAAAPNTVVSFTALSEAKAGTYKLHMYQEGLKLDLYATGAMNGYYYDATEDTAKAADFVITAVDGGYTIKVGDKFAEIVPRTDGSKGINVVFNATQTAGKVWKWNDTIKTFTMMSGNNDAEAAEVEYFLGTSGTFKTFSANKVSEASSKYVGQFGILEELEIGSFKVMTTPVAGTYQFAMYHTNLNKWLYFTGAMDGYYFGTSENASDAAKVVLAAVEGGWTMKVSGGANDGKYLRMYPRDDSNSSSSLEIGTTECVWKWNSDLQAFYVTIGTDNYLLGTSSTGTFKTFSGAKESNFTKAENPNCRAQLGIIVVDPNGSQEEPETPDLPEAELKATADFSSSSHDIAVTKQGEYKDYQGTTKTGGIQKSVTVDGITLTNDIGSSASEVTTQYDSQGSVRLYKGTNLTISYTSAVKYIVLEFASGYASIGSFEIDGATIIVDGSTVTIVFDEPTTSVSLEGLGAQVRLVSVKVYA